MGKTTILLTLSLILSGCYAVLGDSIRGTARETAARDHGCSLARVAIESDASVGMDYAYWIRVCDGRRRFYRYVQTSNAGIGSGRFVDDTNRLQ